MAIANPTAECSSESKTRPADNSANSNVFGTINHPRRPCRRKTSIPPNNTIGARQNRQMRIRSNGCIGALATPTIAQSKPKTASATYVHPRASTILTGSGFFISGTVYQKFVSSELENYTAIIRCQHFVIFGLYLARLEVDPATNANQTMKRTEPAKRNCRHPVLDRHRRSEVFPA